MNFCRAHEERFKGRILCRTCQTAVDSRPFVPLATAEVIGPACQECSVPVDAKVVAFCRINGRRFGRKILCRTCQTKVAVQVS